MSSETAPLLPKEKLNIFENLLKICTDLVFENYQIEKFSNRKKAIIISHFLDKLIKERKKVINYQWFFLEFFLKMASGSEYTPKEFKLLLMTMKQTQIKSLMQQLIFYLKWLQNKPIILLIKMTI